jgi:hypothetical protein
MPRSDAAKPKRVAKKAAKKVKPLTMEELVKWARKPHGDWPKRSPFHTACRDGVSRARRYKTTAGWWAAGDKGSVDRLWTARRLGLGRGSARGAWPDVEARIIAEVRR